MQMYHGLLPATLITLALMTAVMTFSRNKIEYYGARHAADSSQQREALYLPSGEFIELLTFGYQNVASDILWFNTVNYFGKHHRSDKTYTWLAHMCDLVTRLNPSAMYAYEFCSTMLSWEANRADASVALLTRAIERFPRDWNLYFLRGFTHMQFLQNLELAQADFLSASKLPGAHPIVIRLAAKNLTQNNSATSAVEFLNEMLRNAEDPFTRSALESRLREAQFEVDIQTLTAASHEFEILHQRKLLSLEELASTGSVNIPAQDPFGGKYYIDENGKIVSTSRHQRLKKM